MRRQNSTVRASMYHAAWIGDVAKTTSKMSGVKAYGAEVITNIMYDCVQFHGGMGYMEKPQRANEPRCPHLPIGGGATEVMLEEVAKRSVIVRTKSVDFGHCCCARSSARLHCEVAQSGRQRSSTAKTHTGWCERPARQHVREHVPALASMQGDGPSDAVASDGSLMTSTMVRKSRQCRTKNRQC